MKPIFTLLLFVTICLSGLSQCPDYNQDGEITSTDMDYMASIFGQYHTGVFDLNNNNYIDVGDMQQMNSLVGTSCFNDMDLWIYMDANPDETSWLVMDSNGITVEFGGKYPGTTPGADVLEEFTLPAGCYTLIFIDGYKGAGCDGQVFPPSFNGGFVLYNEDGVIEAQAWGNWGCDESIPFCVN